MITATIKTYSTSPISGQTMGTSGLRKRVTEIESTPNYLENFIYSMFQSAPNLQNATKIIIGGDGRYLNLKALDIIVKMAISKGIKEILVGQGSYLSTPAESATIIRRKANAGFILTASHNPAGTHGDFGLKLNMQNGGPAPVEVTSKIEEYARKIEEFKMVELSQEIDYFKIGKNVVMVNTSSDDKKGEMVNTSPIEVCVEVIDSLTDYIEYLHECFNFEELKGFIAQYNVKMLIDGFNAVTGIYNRKVFCELLGLEPSSLLNEEPKPDFAGKHPDPNLTYAKELVSALLCENSQYEIGFAFDGDGDRNLICGKNCFVSPSDSLAVLATHYDAIPFFQKNGFYGVARSMPTSAAVDLTNEIIETPTGWKFFGNLMDSKKISLCGEESFGTGCCGIREKDGIWAALCWISLLCAEAKKAGKFVSVKEIMEKHWETYGRNYYQRHDFDEVSKEKAEEMMQMMRDNADTFKLNLNGKELKKCDDFTYVDPVDGSVAKRQGIRFIFEDGSRIIFRLSGTGSVGATVRIYFDKFDKNYNLDINEVLKEMIELAYSVSQIKKFTGREQPSVIT